MSNLFRAGAACAVLLLFAAPASAEVIQDNGPLATSGIALSIGWNQTQGFRFALTDDFALLQPARLTKLTFWGHMTGNDVNQPQVLAAYVRILRDDEGVPGEAIHGDLDTGLPFVENFTGQFHSTGTSRPIYKVEVSLPEWQLCPGAYWVQFNVDNNDIRPSTGTPIGNYFSSLVTTPPPDANGYHYNVVTGQYFILDDPDTGQGNQPPMVLEGTPLASSCAVAGDFDNDGGCDIDDTADFVAALLSAEFDGCADLTGDCLADGSDIAAFVACVLP